MARRLSCCRMDDALRPEFFNKQCYYNIMWPVVAEVLKVFEAEDIGIP